MAEKTFEQLQTEHQELLSRFAQLETEHNDLNNQLSAVEQQKNTLAEQNRALQSTVGLAGTTAGLPKEVLEDIKRRQDLGANKAHAVEAALRQHAHNKSQAQKKIEQATSAQDRKGDKHLIADLKKLSSDELIELGLRIDGQALKEGEDPLRPGQQRPQRPKKEK